MANVLNKLVIILLLSFSRYGTMPKGARIGAYLESLRQSGMTPEPVTEQGVESDATVDSSSHASESMDRSMIGKPSKTNQMLRSNSSHGGFSAANGVSTSKSPSNRYVDILKNDDFTITHYSRFCLF